MKARDYLQERVLYGGMWVTRGEMMADLQRILPSQVAVDRYLQGHLRLPTKH